MHISYDLNLKVGAYYIKEKTYFIIYACEPDVVQYVYRKVRNK